MRMENSAPVGTLPIKRRRSMGPKDDGFLLRPSPRQMRLLWEYDVKCGHKYMGAPMRVCSSIEPLDKPGEPTLSTETMSLLMSDIKNMWKRLSLICEIYVDKANPVLGYRLRIKDKLPIKVSMKQADQILIGWKAVAPYGSPSHHLYNRSDLDDGYQYLGGPVSFSNWTPSKSANLVVKQLSHGAGRYRVLAETKGTITGGTELLWDYGKKTVLQFDSGSWFKPECCDIVNAVAKPLPRKKEEMYQELCVLCGGPYRLNSRKSDRNAQKKVHFINSHTDFLGSDWNGCGRFDPQKYPIDFDLALLEAERMNRLLQRLHSNGWKVVPACTVMTRIEQAANSDAVMNSFRKNCARLKRAGCIVLRGRAASTEIEHLIPVRPSTWDKLFPDPAKKPIKVYAMKLADRNAKEEELKDLCSQDVMMLMNMSHHDAGDTSEEEIDDE